MKKAFAFMLITALLAISLVGCATPTPVATEKPAEAKPVEVKPTVDPEALKLAGAKAEAME
jgi:cytochrome c biogenesis protein ResB